MAFVVTTSSRITTVNDIINGALRLLQVKSSDTDLTADEANDALEALNFMIDGWSNESLMLYHVTKEDFQLVAGQQVYTIGAGGDFNTSRPIAIEQATIKITNTDWPIQSLAYDDWSAIRLKTLVANYAQYLYLDATYPLGNVSFYPIPTLSPSLVTSVSTTTINGITQTTTVTTGSTSPPKITLYMRKALDNFDRLNQELNLPKGYARALKYNLAVELANEYQTSPGSEVSRMANSSKADLKRTNKRAITLQNDPALFNSKQTRFNIYRGY
jgi:hypothetical protein